ncbi:MAG: Abi family protein [Porphyromonadaceae bacterium]|nr:MAG: Abi family protein [Porphyromonadaceae bacterium]
MKFRKIPVSIADQITLLKSRGLVFHDEALAQAFLSTVSYYRLRAYTYPFQDNANPDHPFIKPVSFEEIIDLYKFDDKLRLLVFNALGQIEIAIRTQIIYHFALGYGSHWHLRPELYRNPMWFANHLDSLQKEIDRSNEAFIEHYKETYKDPAEPPCWMSLEVSSFGLLSKIFQNLKKCEEKVSITRFFGLSDITILENWMLCFSNLRNICAHHGRLWNRRLVAKLKIPNHPVYPFLINNQVYSNKLYAILCSLCYLLKIIQPNNDVKDQVIGLMGTCPLVHEKEMGFPAGWKEESLWK